VFMCVYVCMGHGHVSWLGAREVTEELMTCMCVCVYVCMRIYDIVYLCMHIWAMVMFRD
jgi:hypothetical protein